MEIQMGTHLVVVVVVAAVVAVAVIVIYKNNGKSIKMVLTRPTPHHTTGKGRGNTRNSESHQAAAALPMSQGGWLQNHTNSIGNTMISVEIIEKTIENQ